MGRSRHKRRCQQTLYRLHGTNEAWSSAQGRASPVCTVMPKTTWGAEATWVGQRGASWRERSRPAYTLSSAAIPSGFTPQGIVQIAQVPGNFGTVSVGFKPMTLAAAIQPAASAQSRVGTGLAVSGPRDYPWGARLGVGGVASGAAIGAITGARVGRNPAGGVTRGPGGRAIGQAEFWAQMGQVAQDPVQLALTAVGGPQAAAGQCVWIEQACCKMMTNGLWRCSWPGGACTPGLETCPPWLTQAIRRLPYARGQMAAFMGRAPSKLKRSWVARVRRFLGRL